MGSNLHLRRIALLLSLPVAVIAAATTDAYAQNSTARLIGFPMFEDSALKSDLKTESWSVETPIHSAPTAAAAGVEPTANVPAKVTTMATATISEAPKVVPLRIVELANEPTIDPIQLDPITPILESEPVALATAMPTNVPTSVEPVKPIVAAKASKIQAASTKANALAQSSTIIRGSGVGGLQAREALAESVQAALTSNPEVQIAKAREDDARYGVNEARAAYLPRVDLSASTGPEYNVPDGQDGNYQRRGDASITTRQLLWDFGLTINDIRRARKVFEAASENTRERVEDISFQIATAYVGVLQRQRLVELTTDNVSAHEKILRIVSTQKELGLSTGADVSRVDAQLARIQSTLLDRQSELEQAKENFRRLTGRLPGDLMEPPLPDAVLPLDADAAAALISERNPRLKQVLANRASIERQLASNNANFMPRLEAEVQGNYKNDVSGDTNRNVDARALVQMRYNLFNGGADKAVSNRLKARIREQNFEVERVKREVEQDVRSDFSALRAARDKVSRINTEVDSAAKVVDLYLEQFKTSKRNAFDLLESQQALFGARTTLVGNQYQSLLSGYRVLQKLGLLFTTIVEAPPSPDRKL
jgi:outer membrane protein, adhesin transport system